MKSLVDSALPPKLVRWLATAGHDAIPVRDINVRDAKDSVILDRALTEQRIIISSDSDFGRLLARYEAASPSFIRFRASNAMPAEEYAALLLPNFPLLKASLQRGAIILFRRERMRIRSLTITG